VGICRLRGTRSNLRRLQENEKVGGPEGKEKLQKRHLLRSQQTSKTNRGSAPCQVYGHQMGGKVGWREKERKTGGDE